MQMPITVHAPGKAAGTRICLSAGVPMERGWKPRPLTLLDAAGQAVPLQTQTLAVWPDGSPKWVLLDFQADGDAYTLAEGSTIAPKNPVTVAKNGAAVTFSNGLITYAVKPGDAGGVLTGADGKTVNIVSTVTIADSGSKVIIDATEVYAEGALRAAVSLTGRRIYEDGIEGPFSQRVEMFADSAWIRVEDSFIYSHFPGTHAEPQNPLTLWKLFADGAQVQSLSDPEESEGVRMDADGIAFWGIEPFPMQRHTDEDLFGEDSRGISLGLGKSMTAKVGWPMGSAAPAGNNDFAYTTPEVYAASGAFADFAPKHPLRFEVVEEGMRQALGFWMFFQDNDPVGYDNKGPWHGIFDWGDWQTRYSKPGEMRPHSWQYYEGRYGWDCGEMDTNQMLWHAFIHTGDVRYWRHAMAMSRHAMDVDTIHVDYRKYDLPAYLYDSNHYGFYVAEGERLRDISTIGMGRRHNVQHWGNGIGDTRHTFNAGAAIYYLLTGNRRAYDCALEMADMHSQRVYGYAGGEYCLAQECMYWAYRISGKQKYMDEFKARLEILAKIQHKDGSLPHRVDFNNACSLREEPEDGSVSSVEGFCYSLGLDYISNCLADYHYDTGDKTAAELMLKLAECVYANNGNRVGLSYPDLSDVRIMAWAYLYTRDIKYRDRTEYLLFTMAAQPLSEEPKTVEDWVTGTYNVLWRQEWRIRHIGPGVRMIPYAIRAVE